jgi:hypothetical protein
MMMMSGLMLLPTLLMLLVGMCAFVFWIWSLVDCLTRPDDTLEPSFGSISPKLVWALIIFFVGIIGTIIYLFVAGTKKTPKRTVVQARTAGTDESRRILDMVAGGKISAAEGQRLLAALETKEQQVVTQQMRSTTPRFVWIGCLLLLILPLLFLGLLFGLFAARRAAQERSFRGQSINRQVEQQLRASLGNGMPASVHIEVSGPPATNASSEPGRAALKQTACIAQLKQVSDAIRMFEMHAGHLPAALTDLVESSTNTSAAAVSFLNAKALVDPWNRALRYRQTGNGYEVRSAGADGAFETPDDMAQAFEKK